MPQTPLHQYGCRPKVQKTCLQLPTLSVIVQRSSRTTCHAHQVASNASSDATPNIASKPKRDAKARFGFSYSDIDYLDRKQRIAPLAKPKAKIPVADLLP